MNNHGIDRPPGSRRRSGRTFALGLVILTAALIAGAPGIRSVAQETNIDPSRIIQYRGPMPLLPKEHWGKEVKLKFELYRSPDGGASFWKETRTVSVRKDGWVSVDLGQAEPLPDEAFTTPFRFLSIWHGNLEFTPRKQVASLAYVASTAKSYLLSKAPDDYAKNALALAKAAPSQAPNREKRLDKLVDCGSVLMETHPRSPTNWLSAVERARPLGARLPTFEEWYGAYDGKAAGQLVGMEGHYEWVIPWVYEPTIHARLHELYRGKPVACYYEELSPLNDYPFRFVVESGARTKP